MARSQPLMAVLVDGDNIGPKHLGGVRARLERIADVATCRVYADWSLPAMAGWRDQVLNLGATPIQQFRSVAGKNAIDSALIIDGMDLLHGGCYDAFAIVSSDSDYTRLAIRFREAGRRVFGVGYAHTPRPFQKACHEFMAIEDLNADRLAEGGAIRGSADVKTLVQRALEVAVPTQGVVSLSRLSDLLHTQNPGFSVKQYGARTLSQLLETAGFELVAAGTNRVAVRLTGARLLEIGSSRPAFSPTERKTAD